MKYSEPLAQRNLETTTQNFHKSRKHPTSCTGSNRWWEDRITQEPINKVIFENMHNSKYLQVTFTNPNDFFTDRY